MGYCKDCEHLAKLKKRTFLEESFTSALCCILTTEQKLIIEVDENCYCRNFKQREVKDA